MAFEGLTAKLNAAFKKLRGKGRLSEADIKEAMREIRLALLEADVSYKVVKDFIKSVSERCSGADVMESLTPAQTIVKIVNEELIKLMGSENQRITISPKPPTVVMLVGLQGAGKTTNGAKLAGLFKKQGKRPLLVASTFPFSKWVRRIPSTSPRPPFATLSSTATTWSFSTRQAACMSMKR